ncbi:MAG: Esterase/lipase superfamily enzyme [Verrucomicrobia bacterium]|jgi:esterase/lipase superfamily enzyme|nr:Esterase/lipase superfamily enzyme [Verrucomicrobiota bacterium]MDB6114641.1 Esterase/lipase superfamily enzyme [Lacunisphaera sp.]
MLVFGHAGYPVILFPTSLGRYYQNKDFGLIDSVAPLVDAGKVKIYCPDGIDEQSWYNKSIPPADRVRTHMAYENVILHDVVPHAQRETRHGRVCVAGASFGGYHAMNFALRHPDLAGYCISLSGSFDIRPFLDGYSDNDCYFNNPVDYLPHLGDPWFLDQLRHMGIVLGTGDRDACRDRNLHLSHLLSTKGIPHFLDDRKWCGHDWHYWRDMFPAYLSLIHS